MCHDDVVAEPLLIDLWSDVVCPFCYLGSRQLDLALERFEHRDDVVVVQHAFELDPNATPGTVGLDELLATKYSMSLERSRELHGRLSRQAASMGLDWALDRARSTNTFDAHRLIALATTEGLGAEMARRLHAAYFSDGLLVSEPPILDRLAAEVGVWGSSSLWSSDEFAETVRADERLAHEMGITGVPAFVVDRSYLISGAQGEDAIVDVLVRAWSER